jgi:predicted HicB family RNase H-like nuclease
VGDGAVFVTYNCRTLIRHGAEVQTKLTLRMDDRIIAEAKAWAGAHGVSLSELVAAYLASLAEPPGRDRARGRR